MKLSASSPYEKEQGTGKVEEKEVSSYGIDALGATLLSLNSLSGLK